MANYTLHYFNGRGRAEVCRMMLEVAGIEYTDKRYEFHEWDKHKHEFPGHCLPVLEMGDGYKMPETMAISRYLAREHGFYGKNNLEMMRCDYICDCLYQIMDDYMRFHHWRNGRFRYGMMDDEMVYSGVGWGEMRYPAYDHYMYWKYMGTCNRILPFLERTLDMCDSGNQFFMGDQMMWCDMMFYCCLENPIMEEEFMFSSYPNLRSLWYRVANHPKLYNYINTRCYSMW